PPLWTLNAMPTHPIPPAIPGNRAEYEAQYAKDPDRWYQYLSEAYAWMAAQEEGQTATDRKLIELQVQVEAQQEEILNLQNIIQTMQVEKSAAMMQKSWIEDRLDKKEKELEIAQGKACKAQEEARQAVAARLPTVATLTPVTSDPDAKARIAETMETPSPPATQSAASAQ
ncbi:hypothetical protein BFJ63_vAg20287, partial [Fusarium oxysporum f. sp. narcissi]